MVVAGVGNAGAEEVRVDVDGADHGHQEGQELGVVVGVVTGLEEVLPVVGGHRPVVVLARSVDALEGLLVQQGHQVMPHRELLHGVHDEHIVVGTDRSGLVDRGHLKLGGSDLVVACLGGNAEAPEVAVQIHHEREHAFADRSEVLVLQLLALGRRGAEERAAGQDDVGAQFSQATVDQEILLLGSDVGEHT